MGTATAMHAITSWEEVPVFEEETSEAAFWAAHSVDMRLMQDSIVAGSESSESVTITPVSYTHLTLPTTPYV